MLMFSEIFGAILPCIGTPLPHGFEMADARSDRNVFLMVQYFAKLGPS
jgi:hypothetical protein